MGPKFKGIVKAKPDYAEAHNNRDVVLQDLGQFSAAVESYDKAISLKPEYVATGGNAYGQKQRAQCLRDFSWYLRLVTYGVLAGSTSFIENTGLVGAREMYNSLGVPMQGMVEAMRCLKTASIALVSSNDSILLEPYFDYLVQGMQTSA